MTTAYVYEDVIEISGSYHDGGGLVIVTDRDPADVWAEYAAKENDDDDRWGTSVRTSIADLNPDRVYPISGKFDEQLFVFPDAGCC